MNSLIIIVIQFSFLFKIKKKKHKYICLYNASCRCTFWLRSTLGKKGGGGGGGMGKMTEDDKGGRGVLFGHTLAEVIF